MDYAELAKQFGGVVQTETPAESTPDYIALAQQFGGQVKPKQTTTDGAAGAVLRGAGPYATGAIGGALVGGPIGAAAGVGAVGLTKLVGDPLVGAINDIFKTDLQTPSETINYLLTRAGVSEPQTKTERIIQAISEGAGAAAAVPAVGTQVAAGSAGELGRRVGQVLQSKPGQQIAAGATGAGAAQLAAENQAGPGGQLLAGLAGGVAGAGATGASQRLSRAVRAPGTTPEIQQAEQAGIRVMTTDARPPKSFPAKSFQSTAEKIPLAGTGGPRVAQQTERIDAVKNVLREFGADEVADLPDKIMSSLSAKRGTQLRQYQGMKNDVIHGLGDKGPVPVENTLKSIDEQIAKLQSLRTQSVQPAIDALTDWHGAIQNQNLPNVDLLRKQIGEVFKRDDLASIRNTAEKSLTSIYGAVKKDMGDFISKNGERRDIDKWKIANRRLSDLAGDLEKSAFKNALKTGDATPEVVNNLLFSKKPSDVRKLFAGLDNQGKQHARAAILQRAAQKAGGVDNISPQKFANEVKRLGNSVGVFFEGQDLKRIEGLTKALHLTQRASVAAANPPTGVQVVIPVGAAVLTDFLGGAGAATGTGAAVGLLARAYESPSVRNVLIKLANSKSAPEEAQLFKRFMTSLQALDVDAIDHIPE